MVSSIQILRIFRAKKLIKRKLVGHRPLLVRNELGLRHLNLISVLPVTHVDDFLAHLLLDNGS